MDGLFAGTPPLEALRYLVHEAATVRVGEPEGSKVIMINDVARAFFEAPAMRNVCVEILPEDMTEADRRHDKVGHLRMSMYGTRDSRFGWEGVAGAFSYPNVFLNAFAGVVALSQIGYGVCMG